MVIFREGSVIKYEGDDRHTLHSDDFRHNNTAPNSCTSTLSSFVAGLNTSLLTRFIAPHEITSCAPRTAREASCIQSSFGTIYCYHYCICYFFCL